MVIDAGSWFVYVRDFDIKQWKVLPTNTVIRTPFGDRQYACGLWALSESIRRQYPNSQWAGMTPKDWLHEWDRMRFRPSAGVINAWDEELQQLLDHVTQGTFQIVQIVEYYDENVIRASRVGNNPDRQTMFGYNLYMRHSWANQTGEIGHWEAMERRPIQPVLKYWW
ncbi:hypothetical protein BGZ60DRAFT_404373 [Tricladium varicosporioides]|nr:hypothetical protein BGZ60DRAFT_404373 [Hymenoscyphus varicosporioides]